MTKQKPLDEAEVCAEEWIRRQGYDDIQRQQPNDPPDFVIEGHCAVEVMRLNQIITLGNGDTIKSEYGAWKPLKDCIEEVLAELGSPGNTGKSWNIDCEYDLTNPRPDPTKPWPRKKIIHSQISEVFKPLLAPYDDRVLSSMHTRHFDYDKHAMDEISFPHLCLECGICLELTEFSHSPEGFFLANVSDGEGGQVAHELKEGVKHSLRVKSKKVRDQSKKDKYSSWWLILVDNICLAPLQILSKDELSSVLDQNFDFWSRVIIVSSKDLNWHHDLLEDSAGHGDSLGCRSIAEAVV